MLPLQLTQTKTALRDFVEDDDLEDETALRKVNNEDDDTT